MTAFAAGIALPTGDLYARNLIDGAWRFPAAPYEFEIRNPLDSTITATVPLSSRFDVARAVRAADVAAPGWAADSGLRFSLLSRLAGAMQTLAPALSALQRAETGLDPADSDQVATALVRIVRDAAGRTSSGTPGVSGHILSWGTPLLELAAVVSDLAAGHTVVVKPSLRAPLSAVAVAHLATELGFPPGVINVVQGTGEDVGAALCGAAEFARLHVRASERTLAQATRATSVTAVPLGVVRAGGNVAVAGRDADPARVAAAVVDALRVHSTGGPLGLPDLAVQADVADAVIEAVVSAVEGIRPAPLPTETLRRRALARVRRLERAGLTILTGGAPPDDIRHRMGWVLPPTVVKSTLVNDATEPLGPVLTVRTWRRLDELAETFTHARHVNGMASVFGLDPADCAVVLPHPVLLRESGPAAGLAESRLPAGWISQHPAERF